jgi:hypothetical protein
MKIIEITENRPEATCLHASMLKNMMQSPKHYINAITERKSTPAMEFGTMVHKYLLEQNKFFDAYFVFDDNDICNEIGGAKPRSTNKYKDWYATLPTDKIAFSKDDYAKIGQIANIEYNETYKKIFTNAICEKKYYALVETDTNKRIWLTFTTDIVNVEKQIIADIKTTQSAEKRAFIRDIFKYKYQIQAYLYTTLTAYLYNFETPNFVIVALETDSPFNSNLFYLNQDTMDFAKYQTDMLLNLYADCLEKNVWQGYEIFNEKNIIEVDMPIYEKTNLDYFN